MRAELKGYEQEATTITQRSSQVGVARLLFLFARTIIHMFIVRPHVGCCSFRVACCSGVFLAASAVHPPLVHTHARTHAGPQVKQEADEEIRQLKKERHALLSKVEALQQRLRSGAAEVNTRVRTNT